MALKTNRLFWKCLCQHYSLLKTTTPIHSNYACNAGIHVFVLSYRVSIREKNVYTIPTVKVWLLITTCLPSTVSRGTTASFSVAGASVWIITVPFVKKCNHALRRQDVYIIKCTAIMSRWFHLHTNCHAIILFIWKPSRLIEQDTSAHKKAVFYPRSSSPFDQFSYWLHIFLHTDNNPHFWQPNGHYDLIFRSVQSSPTLYRSLTSVCIVDENIWEPGLIDHRAIQCRGHVGSWPTCGSPGVVGEWMRSNPRSRTWSQTWTVL